MMGLYFLVLCSVGILRPIKNALALAGLAPGAFYKVYFVSAAVVLFVFPYNRLSDRVAWRRLIPGVAFFFALLLLVLRLFYRVGGTAYGMLFYGWYDLYAAVMVTQFFMATQLYFNTREAKGAYPLLIGAGSVGATVGGAITGLASETVGIPNLMLVSMGLMVIVGIGLPLVWRDGGAETGEDAIREVDQLETADLRTVFADRHVRLIVAGVLVMVLLKQFVDYQFNTVTEEVFGEAAAVSRFQGFFNAATQWLPLVAVVALRPMLRRWGIVVALFLLPAFMFVGNAALVLTWSLAAAVFAKGGETALRYVAERSAREILYLPVPSDIKLKAKALIDVGVEKGLGKALSALVLMGLVAVMDYRLVGWVALGLALAWLPLAAAIRSEYVQSLARSIRERSASLRGVFTSLTDARAVPVVREMLEEGDDRQRAFTLDLLDEAEPEDLEALAPAIADLLEHASPELRKRALQTLTRLPSAAPEQRVRERLGDAEPDVRHEAVRTLRSISDDPFVTLGHLLDSDRPAERRAVLATLLEDGLEEPEVELIREFYGGRPATAGDGDGSAVSVPEEPARAVEMALASAALPDGGRGLLESLLEHPEPRVVRAALRSAALVERSGLYPAMIACLGRPSVREEAREALAARGEPAVEPLARILEDSSADPDVRRQVPSVLARIPAQKCVDALLRSYAAPETDQLLDHRSLEALNKLRSGGADLAFEPERVRQGLRREVRAAKRYADALGPVAAAADDDSDEAPATGLLASGLREAWRDRRELAFRCLGLLYPPDAVYRCYLALAGGSETAQANAIEWLEETVGRLALQELDPVLHRHPPADPGSSREVEPVLPELWRDKDRWIAYCAFCAASERDSPALARERRKFLDRHPFPAPMLRHSGPVGPGDDARPESTGDRELPPDDRSHDMELIDKVFLLQQVDLLQGTGPSHLGLLASIAGVVEADGDTVLLRKGEPADALYVVIEGGVELRGVADQTLVAAEGTAFGTWALIDEEPSLVEARVAEHSRLLRIRRREFRDLLTDHPELGLELLRGLARRVRSLAGAGADAKTG